MLKQLDTLIGFVVVMSVVSLLITIITQMISSALGLRGKNLADALEAMFLKIAPNTNDQVKELASQLADEVLTRAVISDSMLSMNKQRLFLWKWNPGWWRRLWLRWKRATAIRPDELLEVLKGTAGATPSPAGAPTNEEQAAAKLLAALDVPTAATTAALSAMNAGLSALAVQKGAALIQELNTATNVALGNLEKWFNSAQDRAQQWFAMQTRFWAVIASIVVAFLLQLDTFRLVGQISNDPELRSKLVASSTAIRKQAEDILTNSVLPESIHRETVKRLQSADAGAAKRLPAGIDSVTTADEWLQTHPDDDAVKKYLQLAQAVLRERLDRGAKQFAALTDEFSKSKFQLVPDPYHWDNCWPIHLRFWGIIASAALLSLGAPFWFNTLKSLTNLRPILANEVDKDPKQLPATPASGAK